MTRTCRLRPAIAIAMVLACTSAWPAKTSAPVQLNVGIGGFLSPSYRVELVSGRLVCTETRRGKEVATHQAQVTEAGWLAFRSELDRLNVWSWRGSYFNSAVSDGTQWRVRISYPDRSLASEGSNSFPDAGGLPNQSPGRTAAFSQFTSLIARLVPGCDL